MEVSKYAEGTHEETEPALNAADIRGRAVATMVLSKQDTRAQRDRPPNTASTLLKGSRFVWSVKAISVLWLAYFSPPACFSCDSSSVLRLGTLVISPVSCEQGSWVVSSAIASWLPWVNGTVSGIVLVALWEPEGESAVETSEFRETDHVSSDVDMAAVLRGGIMPRCRPTPRALH